VIAEEPANLVTHPSTDERTYRGTIATKLVGSRPILMYHGVGEMREDPFNLFISPERFAEQMQVLRILGLRGVSLGQFADAVTQRRAEGLVGLTFDDGYRGVLEWAAPILERHRFTATMFAVSGLLEGENVWDPPPRHKLISKAELRELAARSWEIGAHSRTHPRLTELEPDVLHHEVSASRAELAEVTGVAPRSFCYPYGSVNSEAVAAVRDAGYTYACAVRQVAGLPTVLAMPRIGVTQRDRGPRFMAKLLLRGR
jgi:peptidoglycan/xylan/chitin deacetylase (PgdA/CDA1 family)